MNVNVMRQTWTDDRLDDFRGEVAHRFDVVDQRFDRVEAETRALRAEMHAEFAALRAEMKAGFERVDDRFDRMYRLMLQLGGGTLVALLGLIATQL
jgi:chromosome segregation ATPase